VVSGLPRAGTSLMMAMLGAGGLDLLIDRQRPPDIDNPNGYFEYQPVAASRSDTGWLERAGGKAVKVVYALLPALPADRAHRVLFMQRALAEVVASQQAMLARRGERGGGVAPAQLATMLAGQLEHTLGWLQRQPHMRLLEVSYNALIAHPHAQAARIGRFLDGRADPQAMAAVVDARLYRQRG
jgi:hypothetical protein